MQNVTINNQKCGIDHEAKISLTNGSLVIHRNRLGDVLGAYLVTSFRYNRGVTTDKAKEVRAAINAAASDDYKDYLFITFNSMALGEFFFGTPYHWAWEADPKLNDELYKTLQQYVSKKARLGVILMDYYNNHGSDDPYHNVQRIINTNFGDMYMKY